MYQKINISKLSHAQIGKLLNGHRIRVKHGQGDEIHASQEQHKKITKSHQKGCGTTIQFDPYQIQHHQYMREHGKGIFGNVAKALAPVAINAMSGLAKNYISGMGHNPEGSALYPAGYGIPPAGSALFPAGYGIAPRTASKSVARKVGRPRGRGEGMFGDIAKTLAPVVIDAGANYLKGRGIAPRTASKSVARPGRRGKGMFGDIAKGTFKALAPVAIDAGANYLKGKGIAPRTASKSVARPGRRGKGIGKDILKGVAQYAPLALSFI